VSHDCDLITLVGDIDCVRLPELQSAIHRFMDSCSVHAVVDLSEVTFLDSAGVGFFARLSRLAHARGGTVTVINASPTIVRVIEVCGLGDRIRQERRYAVQAPVYAAAVPAPRAASGQLTYSH
jgi:anti-sigma B factor antagonist